MKKILLTTAALVLSSAAFAAELPLPEGFPGGWRQIENDSCVTNAGVKYTFAAWESLNGDKNYLAISKNDVRVVQEYGIDGANGYHSTVQVLKNDQAVELSGPEEEMDKTMAEVIGISRAEFIACMNSSK